MRLRKKGVGLTPTPLFPNTALLQPTYSHLDTPVLSTALPWVMAGDRKLRPREYIVNEERRAGINRPELAHRTSHIAAAE